MINQHNFNALISFLSKYRHQLDAITISVPKINIYVQVTHAEGEDYFYECICEPGYNELKTCVDLIFEILSSLNLKVKINKPTVEERNSDKDIVLNFFSLLNSKNGHLKIAQYLKAMSADNLILLFAYLLKEVPDTVKYSPYDQGDNEVITYLKKTVYGIYKVQDCLRLIEKNMENKERAYLFTKYLGGDVKYALGKGKRDERFLEVVKAMDDVKVAIFRLKNKSKLVKTLI